ncbi:MAG: hypothetical protein JW750_12560 [Anaerolineaceae bacterium]|nr:hypothetical protein [Anaerolineaceae bacterium]
MKGKLQHLSFYHLSWLILFSSIVLLGSAYTFFKNSSIARETFIPVSLHAARSANYQADSRIQLSFQQVDLRIIEDIIRDEMIDPDDFADRVRLVEDTLNQPIPQAERVEAPLSDSEISINDQTAASNNREQPADTAPPPTARPTQTDVINTPQPPTHTIAAATATQTTPSPSPSMAVVSGTPGTTPTQSTATVVTPTPQITVQPSPTAAPPTTAPPTEDPIKTRRPTNTHRPDKN